MTAATSEIMILLGLATAVAVQIVGALLVLSVLVTPAAAALRVSASPLFLIYLGCRAWGALQNRPPKSAGVAATA